MVDCPSTCQVCNEADESIIHILSVCKLAKETWSYYNNQIDASPSPNVAEWFMKVVRQLQRDQVSCFVMICWNLWSARNDKVWNNYSTTGAHIFHSSKFFLQEWFQLNGKNPKHTVCNRPATAWSRPHEGYLKLNIDAAIDSANGKIGFGWILRNDHGIFVAASSVSKYGSCSPKEAEALAIREALSWLKGLNYGKVEVESDALLVIQSLNSKAQSSSFDFVILDIIDLLRLLDNVSISFVKRSANGVAHLLARHSISNADRKVWFVEPPSFICTALSRDSNE